MNPLQKSLLFCSLSCALSWAWWLAHLLPYLRSGVPVDRASLGAFDVSIGMFGPLLAAVLLRLIFREGFRGTLGAKRPAVLYALAVVAPLGLGALAISMNHSLGLGRFTWAGDTPLGLAPLLLFIVLVASLTALGEEYGWRGYLLPRLLPLGRTRATLLTGLAWGIWHLPLLLAGLTYPGQPFGLAVPAFLLSVCLISFLFTAFHQLSGGSVAIAALLHGSLNALSELTSPAHIPAGNPLFTNPFGLTTALIVLIAVVLLWNTAPKWQPQPQPER